MNSKIKGFIYLPHICWWLQTCLVFKNNPLFSILLKIPTYNFFYIERKNHNLCYCLLLILDSVYLDLTSHQNSHWAELTFSSSPFSIDMRLSGHHNVHDFIFPTFCRSKYFFKLHNRKLNFKDVTWILEPNWQTTSFSKLLTERVWVTEHYC